MNELSTGNHLDFSKIKRVLVTKLRFHGDVLLSTPVFDTLKRAHPHLEIDGLIYHETRDMLSLHPRVENVFTIDRNWKKQGFGHQLKQEYKLYSQLKAREYDLIIHLTEDWRGFFLTKLLGIPFAVTADYPRRRKSKLWQNSFTHIYPVPNERDKVESHLDALRQLGIETKPDDIQLSMYASDEDKQVVEKFLTDGGLDQQSYFLVHPTSRFFYKCWPPAVCASLINELTDRNIQIVLTAAPSEGERAYIRELKKLLKKPVLDLSGQLTLKQLAVAIEGADCFIGVDSAPMHMANAMRTPLVGLFGATNTAIWAPKGEHVAILKSNSDLKKPDLIDGKRPNELENCILDIAMEDVLEAALTISRKELVS